MKKIIFIQLVQKMKPKFIVLAVDSLIVCWYNWIKWDKTGKTEFVDITDPMSQFTGDYIVKRINGWIDNFESRFDPVMVPLKDGTEKALVFRGRPFANDPSVVEVLIESYRE